MEMKAPDDPVISPTCGFRPNLLVFAHLFLIIFSCVRKYLLPPPLGLSAVSILATLPPELLHIGH